MNKERLYWILQIGGWLTFAIAQMIIAYLTFNQENISVTQILFLLLEAAIFLVFTHLYRNLLTKWNWMAFSMSKLIPRIFVTVLALSLLVYFTRLLASIPLGLYNPKVAFSLSNIIGLSVVYAFILFLWVALYFIYHYFEQYNLSLRQAAALHEIELNNLKSQLNPHFIFNALNSIRALVNENPKKSKHAITQLSNILRNTLATEKKKLTTFESEFGTVKDYLGLEGIRFEERLQTTFDIDPAIYNFPVPPLMLQTLVENGVKHGISKLKKGGFINLKGYLQDGQLVIQIRNSGRLPEDYIIDGNNDGLGLRNTRQRLHLLYNDMASFKVFNEDDNVVLTELIIPQIINYESNNN